MKCAYGSEFTGWRCICKWCDGPRTKRKLDVKEKLARGLRPALPWPARLVYWTRRYVQLKLV